MTKALPQTPVPAPSRSLSPPLLPLLLFGVAALLAGAAAAATFRVSPGGSIQAAIDTAIAVGGDNQVKVAAGTFVERLSIPDAVTGTLEISGGWRTDFSEQPDGLEARRRRRPRQGADGNPVQRRHYPRFTAHLHGR